MVYGVYSDVGLRRFIDSGIITSEKSIEETQIQPSSLDLRIGRKLYHLPYSVIPGKNVERYLEDGYASPVSCRRGWCRKLLYVW